MGFTITCQVPSSELTWPFTCDFYRHVPRTSLLGFYCKLGVGKLWRNDWVPFLQSQAWRLSWTSLALAFLETPKLFVGMGGQMNAFVLLSWLVFSKSAGSHLMCRQHAHISVETRVWRALASCLARKQGSLLITQVPFFSHPASLPSFITLIKWPSQWPSQACDSAPSFISQ